uniref:Poly(A) binding protein interacting protein 2 n=1 Tax=Rattus norvegicus TaxID=10116 RepID=A0ABK0KX42_RAT
MKDPSRSSTSPSIINDDVIINGHSHEEDNPFAEYMWMENEEEFNRQIEEELWEEEFIERCFQEMLEEEEEHEWFIPARDLPQTMDQIQDQFNDLVISDGSSLEDLVDTVAVFRHTKRGHQISLQMVVSHHVVSGIELRTSGRAVLNC